MRKTYEESDEAEVSADSDPERSNRGFDEGHGQVDESGTECENTDGPHVDSEMGKTVKSLDISDTLQRAKRSESGTSKLETERKSAYHEPTTTLLEEITKSSRRLLSNDTVNSTTGESSSPSILRELEIFCQ